MKSKRLTVISLLLLSTLTLAGCFLHHGGPRHCKSCCESGASQPCPQQGDCAKAMENKPCCEKMKAAETPAK